MNNTNTPNNDRKVQPPHRRSRRSSSSSYKIVGKYCNINSQYSLEKFVLKSCQFLHRRISSPMMMFEGNPPYQREHALNGSLSTHNATFSSASSRTNNFGVYL